MKESSLLTATSASLGINHGKLLLLAFIVVKQYDLPHI